MPAKRSPFDYRQTAGFYFSALAKIEGKIREQEDIVIDGEYTGEITTNGFCEISENGKLNGSIEARNVTLLGVVDGEVRGRDSIVVKKSAKVRGVLLTPRISIDAGSEIDARIKQPNGKKEPTTWIASS